MSKFRCLMLAVVSLALGCCGLLAVADEPAPAGAKQTAAQATANAEAAQWRLLPYRHRQDVKEEQKQSDESGLRREHKQDKKQQPVDPVKNAAPAAHPHPLAELLTILAVVAAVTVVGGLTFRFVAYVRK